MTELLLIDAHCHLQDEAFAPDLEAVMVRAAEARVWAIVCNGTREDDWQRVLDLSRDSRTPSAAPVWVSAGSEKSGGQASGAACQKPAPENNEDMLPQTTTARKHGTRPTVIPFLGLHPWYVGQRKDGWLNRLENLLVATGAGVGEIGLDRWVEPRDEAAQEECFIAQLKLAARLHRPATIHCVRAWDWLMGVLRREGAPQGMVIHAYGGGAELIAPLVEMGAYFSFAGSVLRGNRAAAQESLRHVPLDRLLIETDAPDMPPPPAFRTHAGLLPGGKPRNEPANLAGILRGISRLRGQNENELAETIWNNAMASMGDVAPTRHTTPWG